MNIMSQQTKKFTVLNKITNKMWGNEHKQSAFTLPLIVIKNEINGDGKMSQ